MLDKPQGCTSNQALQKVKRLLKVSNKIGHTGCLDPLATGLLPICIGEATKFSNFLLGADKSYELVMQLGIKTDTGDLTGEVIAADSTINELIFNKKWLEAILAKFIGNNLQEPPIYSAVKFNGTPLYRLARKAKQHQDNLYNSNSELLPRFKALVQAKARVVNIYRIEILDLCYVQKKIFLNIHCSKGTYIRSFVEDLAKRLNCYATVANLRRTNVAKFNTMINLEELEQTVSKIYHNNLDFMIQQHALQKILLPVEYCVMDFPRLYLNSQEVLALQQGKKIYIDGINDSIGVDNLLSLFSEEHNTLLGVGKTATDNLLISQRLVKTN